MKHVFQDHLLCNKSCLKFLINYLSLKNIITRSLLPILGHLYVRILELLRSHRSEDIRFDAIKSIHSLIEHFDKKHKSGKSFRTALRVSFILKMLPGLSQSLLASIVGEKGRNSSIKAVRHNKDLLSFFRNL